MPRGARLDAPGVLHHLIIRGIERRLIFRCDADRDAFVERLGHVLIDTRTPCYAWALLGNHAHLLLKTGNVPLHTVMARLLTGYAMSFNKRYRRHGQLFQNRYKSILCQEDRYLVELVCYIHLNPLRAGIVKDLSGLSRYSYAGHAALLGNGAYAWQDTAYVLQQFETNMKKAKSEYVAHLEGRLHQGKRPDLVGGGLLRSYGSWAEVKKTTERLKGDQRILGDTAFVSGILEGQTLTRPLSSAMAGITLERLASRVNELFSVPPDDLRNGSRRASVVEARSVFCFWAVRHCGFAAARVASFLHVTRPAVGYAVERGKALVQDKGYVLCVT